MPITGATRVFFIVGDPVAQVRAPETFNAVFDKHGVDAVLVPARVSAAGLEAFVRSALQLGNCGGVWVAIPHKAPMLALLDTVDRLATAAGAVNAVRRNLDGSLEGALFDGVGFVRALDHFGVRTGGKRALVVGVGGGGSAIAASLADRDIGALALFDADRVRAEATAARIARTLGVPATVAASADPAGFDLVVNATPLGLDLGDPMPFDPHRADASATVVDILMKNQPTPLVRACRARGIAAYAGFEMMIQQTPAYLRFFGYDAIAEAVEADASDLRAQLAPV